MAHDRLFVKCMSKMSSQEQEFSRGQQLSKVLFVSKIGWIWMENKRIMVRILQFEYNWLLILMLYLRGFFSMLCFCLCLSTRKKISEKWHYRSICYCTHTQRRFLCTGSRGLLSILYMIPEIWVFNYMTMLFLAFSVEKKSLKNKQDIEKSPR